MALTLCGLATATPQGLPQELQPLWDSMTLEEKVGQMIMVYMSPPDFVIENNLGGVLVMGAHLSTRNQLQKNLKNIASRAKIPLLVTIDQEGGHVNRIRSLDRKWEKAPSAKEMREMAPEKIERTAREIGATLKKTGINLNLAPAIDPPSDINGRETFMELHGRSWGGIENIEKARAFIKGMKASGIISAAKHFPGYDSETNSDLQMAESDATEDKIRENVAPFKALAPDAPVIMMSSVRYTKISDAPAVFEPKIVKMAHDIDDDIVVLTDDLWGTNLRAWISGPEAPLPNPYPASEFKKVVKAALDAGNDMFMTTYPTKAVDMKNTLLELARQSDDYLVRIEKSVARILKMKFRAGLLTSH
ncbi:MAG: glycoside hydrolase family 3 protein [Fibrobacter sp.]|nr:glycoside hydrolase family 3 protein [Fibrobacter sp.]